MATQKLSNDKIFQMRTSEAFLTLLDDWRRSQPTIPSRAEAIRLLVEKAIREDKALGKPADDAGIDPSRRPQRQQR
jgi:hypothetical protein